MSQRPLSAADANSVVLAIQDEIYDYGYQEDFSPFETSGPSGSEARFKIYVKPELVPTKGGLEGIVIYKYLPFGEVIRPFLISHEGYAILIGSPENGFPWTQPNTKTVYMDDDEVCQKKRDWRKVQFALPLNPSQERIMEATKRQIMRVGHSRRRLEKHN